MTKARKMRTGYVKTMTTVAACFGLSLMGKTWAEEGKGEQPLCLELALVDGSRVAVVPSINSVRVETSCAKMDVKLPAGEGPLAFGGVNWMPWRTLFEVQGDKMVSLPKARPGFNYGHGGNGRGPALMTNIGNADWRDYSVKFEFCMRGVDPAFNPHGLPTDYRGGHISFHVADAKESWNECGGSGYNLEINGDGTWGVTCVYNQYCRVPTGFGEPRNDGQRMLAEGKGLKLDPNNGNRFRIDVCAQQIQIWVDDQKIVDVRDEKMCDAIGGRTLDHGGVAVSGGYDCMIWIRNFAAKRL